MVKKLIERKESREVSTDHKVSDKELFSKMGKNVKVIKKGNTK